MTHELAGITGPVSALLAGLVTSLHCAGMCGPLACSVMPARRDEADPHTVATVYHVTRLVGYSLLGALVGGMGRVPLSFIGEGALRYLPWLLVAFFVAVAVRFDQRLPRLPVIGRAYAAVTQRLRGGSRLKAAAVLGLATPLLPCGPLYFLLSLALLSGSALNGAETLLAFGLGTVPLLWFAQANYHLIRVRIGPVWLGRIQTALALVVAAVLVWRLRGTLGLGGPGVNDFVCF
ncbi:sulfite exporter TauE/SafE family protein [Oleiharenicola lentus]|uniref:Sulfite exporter TauE/SafE family protein n=1 Tax=Oleiharenicola lentus TaxID=2508720 RepID=A0A4Q1C8Q2_9BACT|nr:sulfite exporter TauE/SafE family protein [Oleiharenicola lentus]RXK55202.1 sulfite exporter TauE/SafE family protein [Oleiharenicola lentus]